MYEFMKMSCFRKRQSFPSISGVLLAAGIVPSFDMAGLPSLFADTAVSLFWKHLAIHTAPKATESPTFFI